MGLHQCSDVKLFAIIAECIAEALHQLTSQSLRQKINRWPSGQFGTDTLQGCAFLHLVDLDGRNGVK